MFKLATAYEMTMRLRHYVSKQFWFIVCITVTGVALIYFLSSTGILDAMREDDTLQALYDDQRKLPQAPYKKAPAHMGRHRLGGSAGRGLTTAQPELALNLAQERRLQQLNRMASLVRQDIKQNFPAATVKSGPSGTNSHAVRIPHIMHQTWDSHAIPRSFKDGMQSLVSLHPSWEYWFWTPKAVGCFLDQFYPEYSVLFDSYPDATSKADALRYFILHKFGGFYIDIDTKCLKPLDMWAQNYCCLLSEEPYEHSYIVRQSNVSNIVNSPMACQANHKLFEAAIGSLKESAAHFYGDYLQATGPVFLERVYEKFVRRNYNISTSSDNGERVVYNNYDTNGSPLQQECPIVLAPPKYFLPRYDPSQSEIIDKRCDLRTYKQLPLKQQHVCERLIKGFNRNEVDADSYMDHSWIHVNMLGDQWKTANTVPLKEIVPSAIDMEQRYCSS